MTKYYPYGVSLSKGQLEKLSRAYNNNSAITIRLARNELSGPHELMLTKTQINKLRKAMSQGTGSDIKISKTHIRKVSKHGGSLWGSLISLGRKLLHIGVMNSVLKFLTARKISTSARLLVLPKFLCPLPKKLLHRLQQERHQD